MIDFLPCVRDGLTVSDTHRYGRVTFDVSFPTLLPGAVVAVILIGRWLLTFPSDMLNKLAAEEHDEIDIEMLGGDSHHWQVRGMIPFEPCHSLQVS